MISLFLSHSSKNRSYVEDVASLLRAVGFKSFVAHAEIETGNDWHAEIEKNLSECDFVIAFCLDGFNESIFSQHEIGWALALRKRVIALKFDETPSGMLSRYQYANVHYKKALEVAYQIFQEVLSKIDSVESVLNKLPKALIESNTFDQTKLIILLLETYGISEVNDISLLQKAHAENYQIHGYYRFRDNSEFDHFVRSLKVRN